MSSVFEGFCRGYDVVRCCVFQMHSATEREMKHWKYLQNGNWKCLF